MINRKDITKYISAFVLGDGSLPLGGNRGNNARYMLSQRADHRDYVEWQAGIISTITGCQIRERPAYTDKNGWNHAASLVLQSRSLPLFTTIRNRWYLEGRKVISPHDIKLLDAEMLAILYMDDGNLGFSGRGGNHERITISTQSFSWADNKLLRDVIAEKLGLHLNVRRVIYPSGDKYILYASKNQVGRFIETVRPYILPSFEYKIDLSYENYLARKRTYSRKDKEIV